MPILNTEIRTFNSNEESIKLQSYSSHLVPAFVPQAGQKRQAQPDSEKRGGEDPSPKREPAGGPPQGLGGEGKRSQSQRPGGPTHLQGQPGHPHWGQGLGKSSSGLGDQP